MNLEELKTGLMDVYVLIQRHENLESLFESKKYPPILCNEWFPETINLVKLLDRILITKQAFTNLIGFFGESCFQDDYNIEDKEGIMAWRIDKWGNQFNEYYDWFQSHNCRCYRINSKGNYLKI